MILQILFGVGLIIESLVWLVANVISYLDGNRGVFDIPVLSLQGLAFVAGLALIIFR